RRLPEGRRPDGRALSAEGGAGRGARAAAGPRGPGHPRAGQRRMTAPAASAPFRGRVPFEAAASRRVLENGAEVFVLENHFNPTVAVSGTLHGGPLFTPPDRRLLASMTAG